MYDKFLNILTQKEGVEALAISGEPDIEELENAWLNITSEYASSIKTPKSEAVFECWKNIIEMENKKQLVYLCIKMMRDRYSKVCAEVLAELGYDLIEESTREEELRKLNLIEIESQNLDVFLEIAMTEYKMLMPEDDTIKERRMEDYDMEIARVSQFMGGTFIRKNQITVAEWASMVNLFIEDKERKSKK